ncbi:MAG: peptide ABC transporter substrate-binding protein [Myxococcota bacterium]|nr:peptide ABC transporter substrate-binding protein [Myxococcota bacterium]
MTRVLSLLALAALLLSSCQESGETAAPAASATGSTFAFAQGTEPRSLDPGLATDTSAGFLASNLFEGLLVWSADASELLPGVALRWETSQDGRVWTFHLREGAIWSNGDPVTATDFVLAWRRVLNPDTGSDYAALLFPIRGARALWEGEEVDAESLGVEARDRYTLVVTLDNPTPWFPAIVAHHVLAPVNLRALKRHGYLWTRPENIVVNGPFTLESWAPGEQLVLARNPYYHSAQEVSLARVVARISPDPAEVLSGYEAGDLHWTGHASGLLPLERLRDLVKRDDAHSAARLGTAWYVMNTRHSAFLDERVRRALSVVLDRKALGMQAGPGAVEASSLVPPGIPAYPSATGWTHDPDAARKLLADAGYPGGRGFPEIELAVDDRNIHRQVAEWVVTTWKRELGVEARIFHRDWPVHAEALDSEKFEVGRGGWVADYPDPASFLELFTSENPLNRTGWSHAGYDGLVGEAGQTQDAASRMRLLAQAEEVLAREGPVLPLFHFATVSLLSPRVTGYVDNPMGVHLLKYIGLDEAGSGS